MSAQLTVRLCAVGASAALKLTVKVLGTGAVNCVDTSDGTAIELSCASVSRPFVPVPGSIRLKAKLGDSVAPALVTFRSTTPSRPVVLRNDDEPVEEICIWSFVSLT